MHLRDPAQIKRLEALRPDRYSWTACALTRNIRQHSPKIMDDLLKRIARLHMNGENENAFAEAERDDGLRYLLRRRFVDTEVPKQERLADALKRISGQQTYTAEDSLPPAKVELRAQIETNAWSLNQAKLKINAMPLTAIHALINGDITLEQLIDAPYLDGFSIHSIVWDGHTYKDGQALSRQDTGLTAMLATKGEPEKVEIMLEGAHDYLPIQIR